MIGMSAILQVADARIESGIAAPQTAAGERLGSIFQADGQSRPRLSRHADQ